MKNRTLIYGPMFAGKSDKLLSLFFNSEDRYKALIFKPLLDTRSNSVISRSGIKKDALEVNNWNDIHLFLKQNPETKVIFVDEAQFIDVLQSELDCFFDYLKVNNITLFVAMLNKDYLGNNFLNFDLLKPYFDNEIVLSAICHYCEKMAFKTIKLHNNKRVFDNKEIIEIEGNNKTTQYLPVCDFHFDKKD